MYDANMEVRKSTARGYREIPIKQPYTFDDLSHIALNLKHERADTHEKTGMTEPLDQVRRR